MQFPKRNLGDVKAVAALRNCHPATVWRAVAAGAIPKPIKIGGRTLFDLDEQAAVIESKFAEREVA